MITQKSENSLFYIFCFSLLICVTLKNVHGKVGIVYAPFVRDGDDPSTKSYTRSDVKVMLELVLEQGFHVIATHGVGAPMGNTEPYAVNSTWRKCSSIVHTPVAAAEINADRSSLSLSVFLGIFKSSGQQLETEIEVGFEMASDANKLYPSTVSTIVYPSITGVDHIIDNTLEKSTALKALKQLSDRSRNLNMKFGLRLWDCVAMSQRLQSDQGMRDLLNNTYALIICQKVPNFNSYASRPEGYKNTITNEITMVKNSLVEAGLPHIEVILETGWPGVEDDRKSLKDMHRFWKLLKDWGERNKIRVLMQEAFNNPWKNTHPDVSANQYLGGHYGLFSHTQTDDTSKRSYRLKEEPSEESDAKGDGVSTELIIGIVFGTVLFIAVIIMIGFLHRRVAKIKTSSKLTEEDIRQFKYGIVTNEVVDDKAADGVWNRVAYNKDFELKKNKFCIDKTVLLGSGQFGTGKRSVYKGEIEGLVKEVAFKMTRTDCPLTALKGLLSEIKILIYLGAHENIVSICGAYTAELPSGIVYLATELCSRGSLEKHLRDTKPNYSNVPRYTPSPNDGLKSDTINDSQLLRWSVEIASAMEFISSKNVIHADLATRNILLTLDLTAKVTDFGLSRRLYEYTEYMKQQQEPLPWRWMALESLKQLAFSTKSDVWSYGVTLWEIYSMGDVPYPGLSWDVNFVSELERGLRMQRPSRAPINIFETMIQCWNSDPSQRPTFDMIKKLLHSIQLQSQTQNPSEI